MKNITKSLFLSLLCVSSVSFGMLPRLARVLPKNIMPRVATRAVSAGKEVTRGVAKKAGIVTAAGMAISLGAGATGLAFSERYESFDEKSWHAVSVLEAKKESETIFLQAVQSGNSEAAERLIRSGEVDLFNEKAEGGSMLFLDFIEAASASKSFSKYRIMMGGLLYVREKQIPEGVAEEIMRTLLLRKGEDAADVLSTVAESLRLAKIKLDGLSPLEFYLQSDVGAPKDPNVVYVLVRALARHDGVGFGRIVYPNLVMSKYFETLNVSEEQRNHAWELFSKSSLRAYDSEVYERNVKSGRARVCGWDFEKPRGEEMMS